MADDLDDAGMGVAERIDADAGNQIEVTAALQIVHPAPLSARQDERITGIILEEVGALQIHDGLSGAHLRNSVFLGL
ncbi:MAG: hypothetical protein ABSH56_32595 [Bryobacteraceae bacterium]